MHYKYTGTIEVNVPGIGVVRPHQTVKTDAVINHPLFEQQRPTRNIDEQPQTEKKSKSKRANKSM